MSDCDGKYYDECRCARLEYYLSGLDNLTQLLQVVSEIAAETGMKDWTMTYRSCRLSYCWTDAKMVAAGAMTEDDYIARNAVALPDK